LNLADDIFYFLFIFPCQFFGHGALSFPKAIIVAPGCKGGAYE
jgi:hypothetical protein